MSWLDKVAPKIRAVLRKRETPENLWRKCPKCDQMVFHREIKEAQNVCSHCGHHMRLSPMDRFRTIFDEGVFKLVELPRLPPDPLKFRDLKRYTDHLKAARAKSSQDEAMLVAEGRLGGAQAIIAAQNFDFMGGSMGRATGEALVKAAECAIARTAPLIVFTASGGARMQEGILSLMQMPRTAIAVEMVREAGLPYIVVHTDPTSGGVTASFGMLGDIHIAEPGALIAFSGPRVIEQTIRERLPEGFQRAEYLYDHGMVDMVVHRHALRETLIRLVSILMKRPRQAAREMREPALLTNGENRAPHATGR